MRTHQVGIANSCKTHKAHDSYFFLTHQLCNVPALSHETVQHACMRLTSLNEAEGTRLSLHEADKASNSEWAQFLSCKFEAFENTNHDSVLTFDRRGALKISKRDLQEPRSGQDGSKFRYATTRRDLVLKLSIELGFKFHDQWSQNLLKARKHSRPVAMRMRQRSNLKRRTTCQSQLSGEDRGWHQILA